MRFAPNDAEVFHSFFISRLASKNASYVVVSGTLPERVAQVVEALASLGS